MRFTGIISLFCFLLLWSFQGKAQVSAPKYSNEFMSIGVGARAFGMGSAQVSVNQDVTSAYWNPAGLAGMQGKYDISLMHSEYFAGIAKYDYAGAAIRLDSNSAIAFTAIRFGVDDIPDTRFLYDANGAINYDNIRYFASADYGFLCTYARQSAKIEGLRIGGSAKIIHRVVGTFAYSWGFGIDAGVQYQRKGWQMGAVLRDASSTFNAWTFNTAELRDIFATTGNEIPSNSIELTLPRLILGGGRYFKLPKQLGLLATADFDFTFDGKRNVAIRTGVFSVDPKIGMEMNYRKIAYLRFGVNNIQRVRDFDGGYRTTIQPNFGVGIRINKFFIDYALTDIGNTSDALYSNVFSLRINLPK